MTRRLGAAATGTLMLFGLDIVATEVTEPKDPPTVHVVDTRITGSFLPQVTARERPDDPEIEKQYVGSDFIMIFLSGTGMEISEINAAIYDETLQEIGGRAAYLWYGHTYDAAKSAQAVVDFVEKVTPAGETKKIILYGTSFGGMAAKDIVSQPVFQAEDTIKLLGIFVEGSPANSGSVRGEVAGLPVSDIMEIAPFIPPLGRSAIWAIYGAQQIARGDAFNLQQGFYSWHTALKTRPGLARSQLERIRQGIDVIPLSAGGNKGDAATRLIFIAPRLDPDVDTLQAYEEYNKRSDIEGSYTEVDDDTHAGSWHINRAPVYRDAIRVGVSELLSERPD